MPGSIEERLERLEARLDRVVALLERAAVNGPSPPSLAGRGVAGRAAVVAEAELARVDPDLGVRIADVLVRLGDAETLDALARVAGLLPQLEYALQAVAAGPELLEEGLDTLRARLVEAGADDHEVKRRLEAGLSAARALSTPAALTALGALAPALGAVSPLVLGVSDGARELAGTEDPAALRARLGEATVRLAEPDTLAALVRIAGLAPELEYAVQALAAGPTLLEEGLEVARARLAALGVDAHEASRRATAAAAALGALSRVETTTALATLGASLPHLAPALVGVGRAAGELAAIEGPDALGARLQETVLRIAEPEVLESLTRVATLLPDIEYAVQALAAGPVLLEEGLAAVRGFTQRSGGADVDARLRAAGEVLLAVSEPAALAALRSAVDLLPLLKRLGALDLDPLVGLVEALGTKETTAALEAVVKIAARKDTVDALARLAPVLFRRETVDTIARVLPALLRKDTVEGLERVLPALTKKETRDGLERVLPALTTPETLAALGKLVPVLTHPDTVAALEPLVGLVARLDTVALGKLLAAASRAETIAAVETVLAHTPDLQRILSALPGQEITLNVLRTLNAAVADSAAHSAPIGVFGLLGALRDDDVQRAAGFGVAVAKSFGKTLDGRKNGKLLSDKK